MIKLVDIIKEIMNPSEDFYHGTGWELTLPGLDMERANVAQYGRRTGSSVNGTGLYLTRDIWGDNYAHYDNYQDNPFFKQGSKGPQSAEKYARGWSKKSDDKGAWTFNHPIYIYKVKLKPDFNSIDDNSKDLPTKYDMRNINSQERKELLAMGIDGIDEGDEQLILNKDKIASITLAYKATKYGTDHLGLPIWEKV